MRRTPYMSSLSVWIVALMLWSCKTEISQTTWAPVDYQGTLKSMLLPSGELVTVESPEFQSFVGGYMFGIANCLLTISATLSKLALIAAFDLPEPENDAGDWVLDSDIVDDLSEAPDTAVSEKGTFVYIDLACPGPYGEGIGRNFEYGSIRLESGSLNDYSLKNLLKGGHLLFSLNQCQTPAFTVDLQSAGYLLGGFSGVVFDLLPFPFHLGDIRATSALATLHGASVLIDAENAGTFRMDVTFGDETIEARLLASNGAVSCMFNRNGNVFYGCALVN